MVIVVVVVSGAQEADIPVYARKSVLNVEEEKLTKGLLVQGQATPTLGISTHQPTGRDA